MLPFLKPKQIAGLVMAKRKPDGGAETESAEGRDSDELHGIAEELIRALHSKDAAAVASALRDAHSVMCEAEDEDSSDLGSEVESE